jgi:hypothetical protein
VRLYVKLFIITALFALAASLRGQQSMDEMRFQMRVVWATHFGTRADWEALVDAAGEALARETGNIKLHNKGKRYRALLAERTAAAAARGTTLTDDEVTRLAAEVYGDDAPRRFDAERPLSEVDID